MDRGEAQNLSLCAHAVLKLDLLQVAGIAPLELLAPEVKDSVELEMELGMERRQRVVSRA